jgi:hypothetical protein
MGDFIQLTGLRLVENFKKDGASEYVQKTSRTINIRKSALDVFHTSLEYGANLTEVQVGEKKYIVTDTEAEIAAMLGT